MENTIVKLPIMETLRLAWGKVYGAKLTFFYAIIFVLLFYIVYGYLRHKIHVHSHPWFALLFLLFYIIGGLLKAGLLYLGIERAQGKIIQFRSLFYTFDLKIAANIVCYSVLRFIVLTPGFITMTLSIIFIAMANKIDGSYGWLVPGILFGIAGIFIFFYLYMRMILGEAFILDKKVIFMEAFIRSFKATRSNVWRLIVLNLIIFFIWLACALSLGIGYIWGAPLYFIAYGMIYQKLLKNIPA